MDSLLHDLRFALRTLLKNPLFGAVTVFTLAIGIGANTAIFSVLNGVVLSALPYPEADRLVRIFERDVNEGREHGRVTAADFVDLREQAETFDHIAALSHASLNYRGPDAPVRLQGFHATDNVFDLLGVPAALGRTFVPGEDANGAERVVVLSHALWRRLFAADTSLVGRTIMLDGDAHTVVGVMPADFRFPVSDPEFWVPGRLDPVLEDVDRARRFHFLTVLGRMAADVSLEEARSELMTIGRRLEREYPETNTGHYPNVVPLRNAVIGDTGRLAILLMAAVGFVLLIACANVANVMLARALDRGRELALRAALGADRRRLARQLVTESVLMAMFGGVLGVGFAYWGVDALLAFAPPGLPRLENVGIDPTVLAFTALAALLTGLAFGLIPALSGTRPDLTESLKEGGRSTSAGVRRQRIRSGLVVGQIGLSLALLMGAVLVIRSFQNLQETDPGFEPERLLTFRTSLPSSGYPSIALRNAFYDDLLARLRALPDVEAAAATSGFPLLSWATASLTIEGRPTAEADAPSMNYIAVSTGYFRTLGIPLLAGRTIQERDRPDALPVAVVSRSAADRFWPGMNPVGARVKLGPESDQPWINVVGVVGDVRQDAPSAEPVPTAYVPNAQDPWRNMTFAVRTSGEPENLVGPIRAEARGVDPQQPLYAFRTVEEILGYYLARPRFSAFLLTVFAALATLLTAVGVYGTISYVVTGRTHEIGIRIALGAGTGDILRQVVGQGLRLGGFGIVLGLLLSLGVARTLGHLLYETEPYDPLSLATAAAVLVAAALAAAYLPARRAASIDPLTALREE